MPPSPQNPGMRPAASDNTSSQPDVASLTQLVAQLSQQVADLQKARADDRTPTSRASIVSEADRRWAEDLARANSGKHKYAVRVKGMKNPIVFHTDETDPYRVQNDFERHIGGKFVAESMKAPELIEGKSE